MKKPIVISERGDVGFLLQDAVTIGGSKAGEGTMVVYERALMKLGSALVRKALRSGWRPRKTARLKALLKE